MELSTALGYEQTLSASFVLEKATYSFIYEIS